jgi:dephospho-CoA kinase
MKTPNSELRTPNSAPNRDGRKPVVGLVGGIGSGKSAVADAFAARGARVVSGDQIAHEALQQPGIKAEIARRWGAEMLDEHGDVRRRRLGAVVFADEGERRALEALVHPWIKARIRDEVAAAQADPAVRLVVLDAAVMLEAGWHDVCDRLVFVDAPRGLRLRRVAGQRGWGAQELESRERAQLPLTAKAARADHALDNSGSLEHLNRQVEALLAGWGPGPPGGAVPAVNRGP